MSISGITASSLSALTTYTSALGVASQNISNAETAGYTRQSAILTASADGGVNLSEVKRVYSAYLTEQLRLAQQDSGKYGAESEVLASIDALFTESDDYGLSSALTDFWSNWQALAENPADSSARSLLASAAETLCDTFNNLSADLSDIQTGVAGSASDIVTQVNDLTRQIADLNGKITGAEASGEDTSSYQDSRDALVKELSGLVNIDTYTNSLGQLCIQLANGGNLLEGTSASTLASQVDSDGNIVVTLTGISGDAVDVSDSITSGKLGGYLEVANEVIPEYLEKLNTLASELISAVNSLHQGGYDLNGNTGISFFTGTDAGDLAVNGDILADPTMIAAASSSGAADDATIASSIADLEDSLLMESGTATCGDYYAALVSEIGEKASTAASSASAASDSVEFCQNQRDSASSVSIDEELTRLMLYQQAYEAAAKVMNTLDEMMQTLIDM